MIVTSQEQILVTGAAGFIGSRVVRNLLERGFLNIRCLARPSGNAHKLESMRKEFPSARLEIFRGNLLSRADCAAAVQNAGLIYHLAAGRGEKLVADAVMNSVVTTRNLLDAAIANRVLKRIVSVSSFSVYSNREKPTGNVLDESAPLEVNPTLRGDAYSFAKVKQDELIIQYARLHQLPYVLIRPGFVYGPGNETIPGRVGIATFGFFLHLGGSNPVPFTYVENCAEAIVLAGLKPGIDGQAFNVVDDGAPTSRRFLRLYKKNVRRFRSIYLPKALSYLACYLWEKYSEKSEGQLPPAFNRLVWHAYWKKTRYVNWQA
jgi:nucleoside-diphosphate-sugar epimerase